MTNSETVKSNGKIKQWAFWIIFAAIIIGIRFFLFSPVSVNGESMEPTLYHNDKMIVSKLGKIERFDIVVFYTQNDDLYIKRVIGLPGDKIVFKNDKLYINGKAYEEPYLDEAKEQFKQKYGDKALFTPDFSLQHIGLETVPEDTLFVLGDNRYRSHDSRYKEIGCIPVDEVLGTTSVIYWPLNRIQIVD